MKKFVMLAAAALFSTTAVAQDGEWLNRYSNESYFIHAEITLPTKTVHGFYSGTVLGDEKACKKFLAGEGNGMDETWPVAKLQIQHYAAAQGGTVSFDCVNTPRAKELVKKNVSDSGLFGQMATPVVLTADGETAMPKGSDALLVVQGSFTKKDGKVVTATLHNKFFKTEEDCKAYLGSKEFAPDAVIFIRMALANNADTSIPPEFKCVPSKEEEGQSI